MPSSSSASVRSLPPLRTGRLAEVSRVAFPLIMSSGTFAFKLFCDRMMMAWHSERSIAAALGAGMTSFMLMSFFMGVANYANAFVAQYSGAQRHDRTGLAVWQSILFSLAAGLLLAAAGSLAAPIFHYLGHAPELALEEEAYFRVLSGGAVWALVGGSLMCFWTGRDRTWTVVAVGFVSIFLNVAFNWALIFGADGTNRLAGGAFAPAGDILNHFSRLVGAPKMGVAGAGLATIGTDAMAAVFFLILFLRRGNRREFGSFPSRIFDAKLMWRMLRFGFGNGMQMFLDVGSFAVFNILMGMYGVVQGGNVGAASGIALSVNGAAFIPMLGLGAAAAIMVGHGIGAGDIPFAKRAVRSARLLILAYMAVMCMLFEVYPEFLVSIFAPEGAMNLRTREMAVNFLRFAGVFCISDAFFILYGNAIRGAGDTRFSMYVMGFCGWFLFAIPCLAAFRLGAGPYALWFILVFYAFTSAGIFYWRYRKGKWQTMRVIEEGGSQRLRRRPVSVRLSVPVITPEPLLTIPGEESGDAEDEEDEAAKEDGGGKNGR